MSSAKGGKAPATDTANAGPPQTTVLLVQVEALEADETIRGELKKKGFVITNQALVYLTPDDARQFVLHVSNADSPLYAKPKEDDPAEASANAAASASTAPTPRDKVASPRSPRVASPQDGEHSGGGSPRPGDAVQGLTRGPVLMMVLEKPNAVAELLECVGPATPDLWQAAPGCLRARFGVDGSRCGVRCTTHEATGAHEASFLLTRTQLGPSSSSSSHSHSHNSQLSKASAAVDLSQLLDFLFPPHVLHPNSTGRLFVFGLYGPLDARAQLRSGEKGLHVVTDRELDTMSSRMEREDILDVYGMCSLSQEEEEEVLRTVDGTLKAFPRYSRRDVESLFHKLPHDRDGKLSFHDMQAAIMRERCRRVLCMKERVHPALASPILNKFRLALTRIVKTKDEIAPATMFLRDLGFTGAENATLVARLLNNHSFRICHLDDGNSPELTQNVRLLRDQIVNPRDHRAAWSPSTQRGPAGQLSTSKRK